MLAYAIEAFLKTGAFYPVIVIIPQGHLEFVQQLLTGYFNPGTVKFVTGGKTRQQSVYAGLRKMAEKAPDLVLIHDGARPWVSPELILRVLKITQQTGACIPVLDQVNALVEVDNNGRIIRHLDREKIKAVQTPQGFDFAGILAAHKAAEQQQWDAVDDACLYALLNKPVFTVTGESINRKITYREDLDL